jgi:hypothetical protein
MNTNVGFNFREGSLQEVQVEHQRENPERRELARPLQFIDRLDLDLGVCAGVWGKAGPDSDICGKTKVQKSQFFRFMSVETSIIIALGAVSFVLFVALAVVAHGWYSASKKRVRGDGEESPGHSPLFRGSPDSVARSGTVFTFAANAFL